MSRQQQIVLLVVLLIIGGAIWGWAYWPSAGNNANGNSGFLQGYQTLNFPESRLHREVVDLRHKADYKGSGINPFSAAGPQLPVAPLRVPKPGDPDYVEPVIPPPPLPDLPTGMKFFGYGTVPNGTARRAFLSYQDDVYIVSEGDMLMGRYRIVKINNSNLEFEEVASGHRGQKAIEDQGPGA